MKLKPNYRIPWNHGKNVEYRKRNVEFRGLMPRAFFRHSKFLVRYSLLVCFPFWEIKNPRTTQDPGVRGIGIPLLIWQSLDRSDPVIAFLIFRISRTALDPDALAIFVVVHRSGFDQVDAAAKLVIFIH